MRDPECNALGLHRLSWRPDNRGVGHAKAHARVTPPGIARRVGAAGITLAALLGLAGCDEAYGGGFLGAPLDGSPVFNARAKFGFTFQCDAGVKGELTYHDTSTKSPFPGLRLHGTVDTVLIEVVDDDPETPDVVETKVVPAATCEDVVEAPAAHFEGNYRSLERRLVSKPPGRFNVLVFDQGEPSRLQGEFTGDGFAIELTGGPYNGYTRAGYIEGGNIQAE